jgi:hypothetical protein
MQPCMGIIPCLLVPSGTYIASLVAHSKRSDIEVLSDVTTNYAALSAPCRRLITKGAVRTGNLSETETKIGGAAREEIAYLRGSNVTEWFDNDSHLSKYGRKPIPICCVVGRPHRRN